MAYHKQYEKLLYQHEILLARLSVREHFLKTVVKEVYENIGQVLSLIRVQLSSFQPGVVAGNKEEINSSGELVGQTIRELRTMCRLFYPEDTIITSRGIADAIFTEIKTQYPAAICNFPDKPDLLSGLEADQLLLLYSIVLQLLQRVQDKVPNTLTAASLLQKEKRLFIILDYTGAAICREGSAWKEGLFHLSVFDRVKLLDGKLGIKKTRSGNRRIKLELPIQ